MRVVIQRVKEASVKIEGVIHASIHQGYLILLGIESGDTSDDVDWLSAKIVNLRIFSDHQGLMNNNILSVKGEILVISQFTLYASYMKGNRPSFLRSAKPVEAIPLYQVFIKQLEIKLGKRVMTGVFGADMQIGLINDGPVTIIIDTKNKE